MARLVALLVCFFSTVSVFESADAREILRRAINGDPVSIDPHQAFDQAGADIIFDTFEGLLTYGPDGELIPGVALSWSVSDDGRTYLFDLRQGLKWSDGAPLTANDFVFSWRRLAAPETASPFASLLYQVENAREINTGAEKDVTALGVRAVTDTKLEVRLAAPAAYFLQQVAHYSMMPTPRHILEEHEEFWTRPGVFVSNGAYRLEDAQLGQYVRLEKNPFYREAASVRIPSVSYIVSQNRQLEVLRYRADELDAIFEAPSTQVAWIQKKMPGELRLAPRLSAFFLAVNLDHPVMADIRIRKALAISIERDVIVDSITRGNEQPLLGTTPPDLYKGAPPRPAWADTPRVERLAEARALLEDAGYTDDNPLEVEILYGTSDDDKRLFIAVAAMWSDLGVKTKLLNVEPRATFSYRQRREFLLTRIGWVADYAHIHNFLEIYLSYAEGFNFSNYQNPAFDDLMRRASSAEGEESEALYRKAEEMVIADLPIIPLYVGATRRLVRPSLQGWTDNALNVHLSRWLYFSE